MNCNRWTKWFMLLFAFTVAVLLQAPARAQQVAVLVTPEEAEVEPGEGLQLEVFAFAITGDARMPIDVDKISWQIEPDSLGRISEDGFFVAGRNVGDVVVKVSVDVRGRTIDKRALIRIGRIPKPQFRVEVVPNRAVVPSGEQQKFEVVFFNRDSDTPVRPELVTWEVRPERLGRIEADGVFTAGEAPQFGQVIAYVTFDGLRLRASAKVWVAPLANSAISGNIINDADGQPIEDAVVRAVRLGEIPWVTRTTTDSEGNYLLPDLIPGVYVIHANARNFISEFYDDTRNYLEATPLNLAESDTISNIDFGLSEGGKITGMIATAMDSSQLAGAHVTAFLVLQPAFARHAIADENGEFEITALPSGSYVVRADAAGYKGEFYDDAATLGEADYVAVVEPETTPDINFYLGTASAISGVVSEAGTDLPIAGAHVRAYGAANPPALGDRILHETRTNQKGEYLLQVRPGTYIVHVSAKNYNSEFYEDARDRSEATPVVVAPDSHTTNIDFDLVKRSSIAGTVTEQSGGEPIAGAIVEAFRERATFDAIATDRNVGFRAETDSLGNYLIENVPSGSYIILANARGYLPEFYEEAATKQEAEIVTIGDSSQVEGIDFTLEAGGAISGLVATEEDSTPIARALVEVIHTNSGRHLTTVSDADGKYKAGGLPTGEYLVRVKAEGYFHEFYDNARTRSEATRIPVTAPDEVSGIDVYLTKHQDRQGTIAGQVISDLDGSPIYGAVVIAVAPNRRQPHVTLTGPRGEYRLTDLPPGNYYVFSWAEGFIGEFYRDARRFADADPVLVLPNAPAEFVDFSLQPVDMRGVYTIRGRIQARSGGAPLEGILVHAELDDNVQINAITDSDGNFLITGLPAGEYKIEATGAGYANGYYGGSSAETAASVAVGNGEDAAEIDLELETDNITDVNDGVATLPEQFGLLQNYPNPFNPETQISYQLAQQGEVILSIFNVLGQQVRTLVDKPQEAGVYTVTWNGRDDFGRPVASGIYIYRLQAGDNFKSVKRMLLLK